MSLATLRAEFISGGRGHILVVARVPTARARSAVLVVPPFAEEMNKCRRMISELADRLVDCGVAVVNVDVYGTGDSEGLFEDASWMGWQSDLGCAAKWAAEQGLVVDSLLGIRLGCALALDSLGCLPVAPSRLLFWQPALDGRRFLDQFLRLAVAAAMGKGAAGASVAGFRKQLASGHAINIAGYTLAPDLAAAIDRAGLAWRCPSSGLQIDWLEVVRGEASGLSSATTAAIESVRSRGATVWSSQVAGLPFWASTEVAIVHSLLDLTVARLTGTP